MANGTLPAVEQVFQSVAVIITIGSVVLGIWAALKSGVVHSIRFGAFEIEGGITPAQVSALETPEREEPFEAVALSNYYNHALRRANISFWFSLIFASIGFGVIILAFATHSRTDIVGTIVKAGSGAVIDAVSSLFFIQSTNAQKAMGEFFEKLRLDRLNAEAREMIGEIENAERRDELRAQLVLKYSGIERLLVGGTRPE